MSDLGAPDSYHPLYDGMPVVLRLSTRENVIAIVYHSEEDDRLILERPISIIFQDLRKVEKLNEDLNVTRVRSHFERWFPLSDAIHFPIHLEHIVTIVPLSDSIVELYIEWADKLYQETEQIKPAPATPTSDARLPPDDTTIDEIRQSYFDFILHNFKHKGKPN